MKKLYFNYIDDKAKEDITVELLKGEAVYVGSTCIGHTRAQMVHEQAIEFFNEVGAKVSCKDEHGYEYYSLVR